MFGRVIKINQRSDMWVAENRELSTICYRFYKTSVKVIAVDRHLIDTLNNIFAHFISEEEEADLVIEVYEKTADFSAYVHSGLNVASFDSWPVATKLFSGQGQGTAYSIKGGADFYDLLRNIYYTILSFALMNLDRFLQIHASAVAQDQTGIMFPGGSGSGKTTLALALTGAGYSFLADEICLIDQPNSSILPFPRSMFLREDGLDLFRDLRVGRYCGDIFVMREKKCLVEIDKSSVYPKSKPLEAGFIVFPKYSSGGKTELKEISSTTALAKLLTSESILNLSHPGIDQAGVLDSVLALVVDTPCFELNISSTGDALRIVDGLFEK